MYNTRCVEENVRNLEGVMKKVAIIMGSDSDLAAVKPAALMLRKLEIPFAMRVISAHRTPEAAAQFARGARDEG
ncbi:MAG: AIR carboxylase family protein, partial [Clostridia bacterium]|nr:AIR carboxylase family protein [Clostridia bacterium]